jgi:hypothetical protein
MSDRDSDWTAVGTVFDRVAQQIGRRSLDAATVPVDTQFRVSDETEI